MKLLTFFPNYILLQVTKILRTKKSFSQRTFYTKKVLPDKSLARQKFCRTKVLPDESFARRMFYTMEVPIEVLIVTLCKPNNEIIQIFFNLDDFNSQRFGLFLKISCVNIINIICVNFTK